jgi:hypothetical protein
MLLGAKGRDLLYVSDPGNSSIDVFTYPGGGLFGMLSSDTPRGLCVDKAGDVFATNEDASDILEYAHGGTSPIARLIDLNESPWDCSVSPKTGDLAVTNRDTYYGTVVIYRKARGSPQAYSIAGMNGNFCGYDAKGNLFVDGGRNGQSLLAELPFGAKMFKMIQLDRAIGAQGGVQWDGKHVVLGGNDAVYQIYVSGSSGKVVGATFLGGSKAVVQFWIQGHRLIGPDVLDDDVGFWNYPSGGAPLKIIAGLFSDLTGSTVSVAKK